MSLTVEQLAAACGTTHPRATAWLPHLTQAMADYGIDTPPRVAAFLAQVGHESGRLRYVREIWSPIQCAWQVRYERNFAAAWPPTQADQTNRLAYSLGNAARGDGKRFRGAGPLQLTGRNNFRAFGLDLGIPAELHPELLESMKYGALAAGWFWRVNALNTWADASDIDGVSDVINRGRKTQAIGDANGYADRLALYRAGMEVLA